MSDVLRPTCSYSHIPSSTPSLKPFKQHNEEYLFDRLNSYIPRRSCGFLSSDPTRRHSRSRCGVVTPVPLLPDCISGHAIRSSALIDHSVNQACRSRRGTWPHSLRGARGARARLGQHRVEESPQARVKSCQLFLLNCRLRLRVPQLPLVHLRLDVPWSSPPLAHQPLR